MLDLGHGKPLDDAPGVIGVTTRAPGAIDAAGAECPPLPDTIACNPTAGFLDPRAWFRQPGKPLDIEIGCGKGTFLLEQSGDQPDTNYLGIEWTREYYMYTADRIRRAGRQNVRVLHADATDFLKWRCPNQIVQTVHLYFSDPWPKAKHHKNRVVQHRFLREVWRVLVPGGELRIVTDHDELWAWNLGHIALWTGQHPDLATSYDVRVHDSAGDAMRGLPQPAFDRASFVAPAWVGEGCVVGTNYERKKCVAAGKEPYAVVLRKRGSG